MDGDRIFYWDNDSFYVLANQYSCQINIYPAEDILTDFIKLSKLGWMDISKFYAWDGPSGPTFDTKSTMRTSLIHDATFQLFRLKLLDMKWFNKANDNLRDFGVEDGMWKWRANLWHSLVVQKGMVPAATNAYREKIVTAPF